MLAQQVMLLLQMFTFFREVSFVFVFLPLLVVAVFIMCTVCFVEVFNVYFFFFGLYLIPSVVLLMLKADNLLGVGTAVLIGDAFPKFSWSIVMIPVWMLMGFVLNFFFLFVVSITMDDD